MADEPSGQEEDRDRDAIALALSRPGPLGEFRPLIAVVRVVEDTGLAEVTLDLEGWVTSGLAQRAGDVGASCAAATLEAVAGLIDEHVQLSVGWVQLVGTPDGGTVAHVAVDVDAPEDSDTLLGAAFVRTDPHAAVVRATLDALNRRLGRLARER